jgi:hypothetical protein
MKTGNMKPELSSWVLRRINILEQLKKDEL